MNRPLGFDKLTFGSHGFGVGSLFQDFFAPLKAPRRSESSGTKPEPVSQMSETAKSAAASAENCPAQPFSATRYIGMVFGATIVFALLLVAPTFVSWVARAIPLDQTFRGVLYIAAGVLVVLDLALFAIYVMRATTLRVRSIRREGSKPWSTVRMR